MSFSQEEFNEFLTEAKELLEEAEKSLIALSHGEDFKTHYSAIFRAFHSIKGAAGMMEMAPLQNHMHQIETILTQKQADPNLSPESIDFFLRSIDCAIDVMDGKNTSFDYTITQGSAPAPRPTKLADDSNKNLPVAKILIVDDEPDLLETIDYLLKDSGFATKATLEPRGVLDLLEEFQPDVILSDVKMPGITGLELLAKIREKNPDVPVILLSGYVDKEMLLNAVSHGVYTVLEKPFDDKIVIEACLNASKKYRLVKLLNKSLNLIMYQFSDLDDFLKSQGKEEVRSVLRKELDQIFFQRREIRNLSKKSS